MSVFMVCQDCGAVMALDKLATHMLDAHQKTLKHVQCCVCDAPVADVPAHFRAQHAGAMPNVRIVSQ